jgi:hypothetical protein
MMVYHFKAKKKEALTFHISKYFAELIPLNASLVEYPFQKEWERIDIIVPVLYKFEKLVQDESWEKTRLQLISEILLPLARKASHSFDWVQRFFAAESFGLVYEEKDEIHLVKLVKDKNPLIRLNALTAAIFRGSKSAINLIITEMASASWLTQSIYLQSFEKAPPATREFIVERLKSTPEDTVKATCYNILSRYPQLEIDWQIDTDILSNNMKLRLAAIQYLSYIDKNSAIPILLTLIKDPHWQARTVALYILNKLRYTGALPEIRKCLSDENEWVRLYAEETLKNLDNENIGLVRTRDVSEEKAAFDVALQVLDTY